MLKSHVYLLDPRPSDRLRIGDRIVDIPLREITPATGGDAVRVTLKPLAVLLALVAHANRLVSREALLEWVWPDTLPSDDVVTQAITQLRKALGDDREHPRYIETLAKQGYRLVAPVEWLIEATDDPGPAALEHTQVPAQVAVDRSPPRLQRTWAVGPVAVKAAVAGLAVAGVIVTVAAAVVWRDSRKADHLFTTMPAGAAAPVETSRLQSYLRIASLPVAEERPSLSPDGSLVVYVRSARDINAWNLVLQTTAAVSPRALTEPLAKRYDLNPAWSPDGRQIAFLRYEHDRCKVMTIPAAGGSARELGECIGGGMQTIAWYPDGKALVGARSPGAQDSIDTDMAVYRMPLDAGRSDTGRWERIAYQKSPSDEDVSPVVSPDGRWIAFQRNLSLGDLWRIPAGGGEPRRLTDLRTNIYGLAWTPDSRHLVFSRYVESKIVLSTLAVGSGHITDVARDDNNLMYPSVSSGTGVVAFEVEQTRSQLRQVAVADGEQALGKSEVMFDTTGSNLLPSISPDGRQLLFYSDRTGAIRLWWVDQEQPDSLRSFDGFVPTPRHPVMWNADSQRALAIGSTSADGTGIYEIEPRTGRVVKLPVPEGQPVHVSYHPDPDRLLVVADRGQGRLGVVLYDRSRRPWRVVSEVLDVAVAVVDPRNRRILMASMSKPELHSADLELHDARLVDRVAVQRRNRILVPTPEGVRVLDARKGCSWYWRLVATAADGDGSGRNNAVSLSTSNTDGTGQCLGHVDWYLEGLSHHPVRNTVYLSMIEHMQSDIGLMPLSAILGEPTPEAGASR